MSALAAYEAGLDGRSDCWLHAPDGSRRRLPVRRWLGEADRRDAAIVAAVLDGAGRRPRVLDVGCGPGRLTVALDRAGAVAFGLDVSAAAVAITRARGATAIHGDVFAPVPGAGGWDRVLLADGNLGIGGDPARLLRRAGELLAPGGRVVADVEPAGGIRAGTAWLDAGGADGTGGPLPWAWIGTAAVPRLAADSGLRVLSLRPARGRVIAVWEAA